MERMTEADQAMLLLSLQREMTEMKRRAKEVVQKNGQEMQALRRENEEMKKKLMKGCLHHPYESLHLRRCSVVPSVSYIADGSNP